MSYYYTTFPITEGTPASNIIVTSTDAYQTNGVGGYTFTFTAMPVVSNWIRIVDSENHAPFVEEKLIARPLTQKDREELSELELF